MSYDEQRKRIFELESTLGTAIKICEKQRDEISRLNQVSNKMGDMVSILSLGIKSYINTMDKKYLLNAVDSVREYSKTLNTVEVGAGDDYPIIDLKK